MNGYKKAQHRLGFFCFKTDFKEWTPALALNCLSKLVMTLAFKMRRDTTITVMPDCDPASILFQKCLI
jgi:hypothetical protein